MQNLKMSARRWSLVVALVAGSGAAGALSGCSDFMAVENPGAIETPALESEEYIGLMVGGVIGDFQPAFAWTALWSGVFADELRNHHSYFENPEISRRDINDNNATYMLSVYNGLHRARFMADSIAGRLEGFLADSADQDLNLARVQAYGGYAWTLLGEQFCETHIEQDGPFPPDQLLGTAIERFDAAIEIGSAAKAAAAGEPDEDTRVELEAGADSLMNFARVGAARAALDLAAYADPSYLQMAIEYAAQVTPAYVSEEDQGFAFAAHYELDGDRYTRRVSNPFWEFITDSRWFSIGGTPFELLGDPRVPHSEEPVDVSGGAAQYIAYSPSAFSSYTGTAEGAEFERASSIRIASALEARYIIAEAEGLNAGNLAFVNERRAIGGDDPLAGPTSDEYLAALREQRARDFYLDSHRMGDLRRYKEMYGLDLWQRGSYYGSESEVFGEQECWPIPRVEKF